MTKSERIMFLINLIKNREAISVEEMSGRCGVSERTIYRDLKSLAKMNIPVFFDNDGYRLSDDSAVAFDHLTSDEMELVMFCLQNNQLTGYPFFESKFSTIERKLRQVRPRKTTTGLEDLFIGDRHNHIVSSSARQASDVMDRFVSAALGRKIIAITVADGSLDGVYIPLAIRVKIDGARLVMTRAMDRPAIEVPVSSVRQLIITASRFERRPVELLHAE